MIDHRYIHSNSIYITYDSQLTVNMLKGSLH